MKKKSDMEDKKIQGTAPLGTFKIPDGYVATIEDGCVCIKPAPLTPFEGALRELLTRASLTQRPYNVDILKSEAGDLMKLARKQIIGERDVEGVISVTQIELDIIKQTGFNEGYIKGMEEAEKRHKESEAYNFNSQPNPFYPPCFSGGPCINPHHDCINCPRQGADGVCKTNTKIE